MIYNNSWYTMYATSGLSILNPKSIDNVTSYKVFVRNNIVYNNKTQVPWLTGTAPYELSDGNGIIFDINMGTSTSSPYVGRYLVENNLSYNNGGGGIHVYKAAHIDMINNTTYNNGTVVGYPEMDCNQGSDVKIYNNIMYGRPTSAGGKCNGNDAGAVYNYNVYFNGKVNKTGANDIVADPKFVQLPTITSGIANGSTANFSLQSTSPAIYTAGQYSPKDILGLTRPVGDKPDRGAYEYSVTTEITDFNTTSKGINIYPNPAHESVMFEGINENSKIIFYDILGKEMFSEIANANNAKINLSGLKQGIYFFRIISKDNIVETGKLIKE